MKLDRITVGVDEGELARHAVDAGVDLARRTGARVELVHCVPLETDAWTAAVAVDWYEVRTTVLDDRRKRVQDRLAEWYPKLPPQLDPLAEHLTVLDRKPSRALPAHAEETGAALMVIGGHTKAGLFDFGGTARALLHHPPCALWVQPEPVHALRTILAPVDPVDFEESTRAWIAGLARELGARVVPLHAWEPPAFAYEPLAGAAQTLPVDALRDTSRERFDELVARTDWGTADVEPVFVETGAVEAVLERAREADLVVLGTHGRSALGRAFLGSVTYAVVKSARKPVLAVPLAGAREAS